MNPVLYGLKRHWLPLLFLLIAGGWVYYCYTESGKGAESLAKEKADFENAEKGLTPDNLPPWGPNEANLEMANANLRRLHIFIQEANGAMMFDYNATAASAKLREKLRDKVKQLNHLASGNSTGLRRVDLFPDVGTNNMENLGVNPKERENYPAVSLYHFTFGFYHRNMYLNEQINLRLDQLAKLRMAMGDVENIAGKIMLTSGIRKLVGIQRIRLDFETKTPNFDQDYLKDLARYENDTAEGYPYRVVFQCNPRALATVLRRVTTFDPHGNGYYIIRSISIDAVGGGAAAAEDGSGKKPPGRIGNIPGAAVVTTKPGQLKPGAVKALLDTDQASLQATSVVGPDLIEVKLHLDIIRKKPPAAAAKGEGEGEGKDL